MMIVNWQGSPLSPVGTGNLWACYMILICFNSFWHSEELIDHVGKSSTGLSTALSMRLSKHTEDDILNGGEGIPLRRQESFRWPWFMHSSSRLKKRKNCMLFLGDGSCWWCQPVFYAAVHLSKSCSWIDKQREREQGEILIFLLSFSSASQYQWFQSFHCIRFTPTPY